MRKWMVFLLFLLAVYLPVSQVQAQESIALAKLEVDLWPEYDRTSMLVIYHLFLPANTPMPANLSLRIPSAAGDPFNIAVREADGMLYNIAYTREVEGVWSRVNFTTTAPEVQFEYYDPRLAVDQNTRSFTYNWAGDYAVDSLSIQVQQPIGATDMQLTPNLGSGLPGEGGVTYYNAMVGQVPVGTEFTLDIHYQKADSQLSIEKLQVNPSQPLDTNTAGRVSLQQILPYLVGAIGVLLVGGGGWWLWLSRQPKWVRTNENRKRHPMGSSPQTETHPSQGPEKPVKPVNNDSGIYCHQCGRRAAAGDLFCRACGTTLRKE